MLFNSFQFLLFFPIVTIIYFLLPHKIRWLHLLLASCVFYMAFIPVYILILFAVITIDYVSGIMIERLAGTKRAGFLALSITANIGVLAFFKYCNFFIDNINFVSQHAGSAGNIHLLKIILPIGLSFHTFQAISYTVEVYRGNQKAEKHFGIYALYVMFYPQLVAGPIERPQNMLHQFHEKKEFSYNNAVSGLRLMLWGVFKKVVIADTLALVIDPVYNHPQSYSPLAILTVVFLFAYEIYCDFSGYTDIALGAARVMGFTLMANFDYPFRSKSITEFWRRWHISLSSWFYDYLFNPLATRLRSSGKAGIIFTLLITFFLSGLWHGAGWKFAIFGLIHGIAIVYEYLTRKQRKKLFALLPHALNNFISRILTLSYVILSWVFFRAINIPDALYILKQLPLSFINIFQLSKRPDTFLHQQPVAACFFLIVLLEIIHFWAKGNRIELFISNQPKILRWGIYLLLIFSILVFGTFDNKQFIYFQF